MRRRLRAAPGFAVTAALTLALSGLERTPRSSNGEWRAPSTAAVPRPRPAVCRVLGKQVGGVAPSLSSPIDLDDWRAAAAGHRRYRRLLLLGRVRVRSHRRAPRHRRLDRRVSSPGILYNVGVSRRAGPSAARRRDGPWRGRSIALLTHRFWCSGSAGKPRQLVRPSPLGGEPYWSSGYCVRHAVSTDTADVFYRISTILTVDSANSAGPGAARGCRRVRPVAEDVVREEMTPSPAGSRSVPRTGHGMGLPSFP